MGQLVDLEKLTRVFARTGERVVLVIPGQEPVVLVPLADYEKLHLAKPRAISTPVTNGAKPVPLTPKHQASVPAGTPVEAVDPIQGGVESDDQYFPEPLD